MEKKSVSGVSVGLPIFGGQNSKKSMTYFMVFPDQVILTKSQADTVEF
jgi:hypothetical protein